MLYITFTKKATFTSFFNSFSSDFTKITKHTWLSTQSKEKKDIKKNKIDSTKSLVNLFSCGYQKMLRNIVKKNFFVK